MTSRSLFDEDEPARGTGAADTPLAERMRPEDLRRAGRSGRSRRPGPPAAAGDRTRHPAVDHPVGPPRQRQDDPRPPHRRGDDLEVRRVQRGALGHQGDPGGAGGGGGGAGARRPEDDSLCRRDPPLQQGPAGRLPPPRRGGRHRPHRSHHREPLVRGQRGAALALAGVRAEAAAPRGRRHPARPRPRRCRARDRQGRAARRSRCPGRDRPARQRGRAGRPEPPRARGRRGRGPRGRGRGARRRAAHPGHRLRRDAAARAALRQERRGALQPDLRPPQVDAQQRSGRGGLLARPHAGGRRGPPSTSPAAWSASRPRTSATPTRRPSPWPWPPRRRYTSSACRKATPPSPRAAVYLATAPKSNAVYRAYGQGRRRRAPRGRRPGAGCICATRRRA